MLHTLPAVRLPRTDGTQEVFCQMSYRDSRPCNGRARFDADGVLLDGVAVYFEMNAPRYFCSRKCVASYIRTYA